MIYWRDFYNIGIPQLDNERKLFFSILNQIESMGFLQQKKFVEKIREKTHDCLEEYFNREVNIFNKTNCPISVINIQMKEHNSFIQEIEEVFENEESASFVVKFINILKTFTINHIIGSDLETKKYIKDIYINRFLDFIKQELLMVQLADKNILVNWNSFFETGIEHIDRQHMAFAEILNDLVVNYDIYSNDSILEIINEFRYHALLHFEYEEEIMGKISEEYEDIDSHIRSHEKFVEFLDSQKTMFSKVEQNGNKITGNQEEEFIKKLIEWLTNHILNKDKKFAKIYLNKYGKHS